MPPCPATSWPYPNSPACLKANAMDLNVSDLLPSLLLRFRSFMSVSASGGVRTTRRERLSCLSQPPCTMRKALLSLHDPRLRRAPAPSACSRARAGRGFLEGIGVSAFRHGSRRPTSDTSDMCFLKRESRMWKGGIEGCVLTGWAVRVWFLAGGRLRHSAGTDYGKGSSWLYPGSRRQDVQVMPGL